MQNCTNRFQFTQNTKMNCRGSQTSSSNDNVEGHLPVHHNRQV